MIRYTRIHTVFMAQFVFISGRNWILSHQIQYPHPAPPPHRKKRSRKIQCQIISISFNEIWWRHNQTGWRAFNQRTMMKRNRVKCLFLNQRLISLSFVQHSGKSFGLIEVWVVCILQCCLLNEKRKISGVMSHKQCMFNRKSTLYLINSIHSYCGPSISISSPWHIHCMCWVLSMGGTGICRHFFWLLLLNSR